MRSSELLVADITLSFDLQEVITNEHVVAMMKAAINETEAIPPFVSLPSNQNARRRVDLCSRDTVCSAGAQNDPVQV